MDYKQIVWLASYPKSGNTWVRCFLDAYLTGSVDINEILCSIQDDLAAAHQVGDGSDVTKLPIDVQQLTRPMALVRVVRRYLSTDVDVPLFVKTHSPNMIINGVELFPAALTKKIVYLVRDPKDVLPSFSRHMGTDMETGLEWMQDKYRTLSATETRTADFLGRWDSHVMSFLNDDVHDVLIIKYEDLKANPVECFSEILKHSGIDVDQERVKRAIELVSLGRLKKQEDEKGFQESSPHSKDKFFGRTKEKPSLKQINTIERKFKNVLKRMGYLKSKAA
jgi:hypothetical protein